MMALIQFFTFDITFTGVTPLLVRNMLELCKNHFKETTPIQQNVRTSCQG